LHGTDNRRRGSQSSKERAVKNGKAAGIDQIQPELLKHSDAVIPELARLCNIIWKSKRVPSDWRNGVTIPLPKKGDLADCNNRRGIMLLSVPGKVFCSILLERIQAAVDSQLRQ